MQCINPPCVLLWTDFSQGIIDRWVSSEELKRAKGMKSEKRRKSFLAGRGLLRAAFSSLGLKLPNELQQLPSGKPHSAGQPHFNISHTGFKAALAIDENHEVGIDIEVQDLNRDFSAIADEYGSAVEQTQLAKMNKTQAAELFFKVWALKEAFAKAKGEGLSTKLRDLEFDLKTGKFSLNEENGPLTFFYANQDDLHIGICRRGKADPPPRFYSVQLEAAEFRFQLLQGLEVQIFEP